MLKQAIIIAGGLGKRMGKLTYDKPKSLIKVFGQPILNYILDSAIALGIEKIIIVTSQEWANTIEQYIHKNYPKKYYPCLEIILCCSPRKGVGYSLYCASRFVDFNAPILITVSDVICFDGYSLLKQALNVSDFVLGVSKGILKPKNYTLASINAQGKLCLNQTNCKGIDYYPLMGVYALKPVREFFDYLNFSIESVINNRISKEEAIQRKIINHQNEFRLSFVKTKLNQDGYKPFLAKMESCYEVNVPQDLIDITTQMKFLNLLTQSH